MQIKRKGRLDREAHRIIDEAAREIIDEASVDDSLTPPPDKPLNLVRWIKENVFVQLKGGGTIPFNNWWPVQKRIAAIIVKQFAKREPAVLVILKSRQMGISTVIRCIIFALTRHYQNTLGVTVAQTREATQDIFSHVKVHVDFLPNDEKASLPIERGEAGRLELKYASPWFSKMVVRIGERGMRSQSIRYAHVSEVDMIRDFPSVWTALIGAMPTKEVQPLTLLVAETTAKGKRAFYPLWKEAQLPHNNMIPIFIGWKDDPTARVKLEPGEFLELDEAMASYKEKYELDDEQTKWAMERLSKCMGDWQLFHSEYPVEADLAFGSGAGEWFRDNLIKAAMESALPPVFRGRIVFESPGSPRIKLQELAYGETTIWEHPQRGVRYAIGGDVGHGIQKDYTVVFVKRCDTKRTVAQWRSNRVSPGVAAVDAYILGAYYGFPLMGIENNGPGVAMLTILQDGHSQFPQTKSGYPALYYQTTVDQRTHVETKRFGFMTTGKSKTAVLEAYRDPFNYGVIQIDSKELLWEMDGFFFDSISHECAQANQDPVSKMYHDDCVVAEAIAYQMTLETERGGYCPAPTVRYYGVDHAA